MNDTIEIEVDTQELDIQLQELQPTKTKTRTKKNPRLVNRIDRKIELTDGTVITVVDSR